MLLGHPEYVVPRKKLTVCRKTFIIPEVIFDPTLLLSPHVFLLGILYQHKAFLAEGLNKHPSKLAELTILRGENELRIPLRPELDNR